MILLLGADTLVGECITKRTGDSFPLVPLQSDEVNIYDEDNLEKLIGDLHPEVIINCIEYSNMVRAEYMREDAYNLNGLSIKKLAGLCSENAVKLVHMSSSYIFKGDKKDPYNEADDPDPVSVYGDSKLLGERMILESGCRFLIIRIPDVYGTNSSFLQRIMKRVIQYGSIKVIRGQYISPLSSMDAAEAVDSLLNNDCEGIYHLSPSDYTSASAFITTGMDIYKKVTGKEIQFDIIEKDYKEFRIIAERPFFNVLDSSKYMKTTGMRVNNWKTSFNEFILENGGKF